MIVITGAAGFIGSNIAHRLNRMGYERLILVDFLQTPEQISNIHKLKFEEFLTPEAFRMKIRNNQYKNIEAIYHQGACSDTMCDDWSFLYDNNYVYTKEMMHYCCQHDIKLIYASSASVYGMRQDNFTEHSDPTPINYYALSKSLTDQYAQRILSENVNARIYGLRYFNVYGQREQHKGKMSSVMFHFRNQVRESGIIKLFGDYSGVVAGEQSRDFIHVDDVVESNINLLEHNCDPGVYNVGTGLSYSYNTVASIIISHYQSGRIEYIDFPEKLVGRYQNYTCADITKSRENDIIHKQSSITDGIVKYMKWLDAN